MPAVEFPDVEAMVIAFVKPRTTAKVGTRVAKPRPPRYVQVTRTGGGAINRVLEQAQITVTCGAQDAPTETGGVIAMRDARALRTAFLNSYTAMSLVRGVQEVVGPYADPDPDTGEDRVTFTIQLSVRGAR